MKHQYSEDLFADTRMSFGEHLEDLRTHLMRAVKGFLAGLVLAFFIGSYVLEVIKAPVEAALLDFHLEHFRKTQGKRNPLLGRLRDELGKEDCPPELKGLNEPQSIHITLAKADIERIRGKADAAPAPEAMQITATIHPIDFVETLQGPLGLLAKRSELTTLSAQEAFMVYFKVCILTGLVITSPYVFWQIWAFVAAGLYPHEKRYVYYALGPSIGLFLGGVLLCQFYVIPVALRALLGFNLWLNLEPDLRLNEWLGFAILMPVFMGLFFQTPLVMLVLGKIGIFTAADFAAKRKIAMFVMLIVAAFAPTVDLTSLFMLWAPMIALYELGILLVRYSEKRSKPPDDEEPYVPAASGSDAAGQG